MDYQINFNKCKFLPKFLAERQLHCGRVEGQNQKCSEWWFQGLEINSSISVREGCIMILGFHWGRAALLFFVFSEGGLHYYSGCSVREGCVINLGVQWGRAALLIWVFSEGGLRYENLPKGRKDSANSVLTDLNMGIPPSFASPGKNKWTD